MSAVEDQTERQHAENIRKLTIPTQQCSDFLDHFMSKFLINEQFPEYQTIEDMLHFFRTQTTSLERDGSYEKFLDNLFCVSLDRNYLTPSLFCSQHLMHLKYICLENIQSYFEQKFFNERADGLPKNRNIKL